MSHQKMSLKGGYTQQSQQITENFKSQTLAKINTALNINSNLNGSFL